jgi:drug/metabolite transporter (DMT)-like permease
VLAVVLALASAVGYGGSDFAAGIASRAASVIQVTLLASAAATVAVAVALPLAASQPPTATALGWGAAAGLGGVGGAFALYLGFRHAAFSVAGPLSAVGAAGFSVLAGLLLGERPSGLALTGIILALPAIVGVSASAGGTAAISPAEGGTVEGGTVEGGTVEGGGAGVPVCGRSRRRRGPRWLQPPSWPW